MGLEKLKVYFTHFSYIGLSSVMDLETLKVHLTHFSDKDWHGSCPIILQCEKTNEQSVGFRKLVDFL